MKMTPLQVRQYIDQMRIEHLRLKADIENCEFQIEHNKCPECHINLTESLEALLMAAEEVSGLPKSLIELEEYLAEDEAMNGWKGEDRVIEF